MMMSLLLSLIIGVAAFNIVASLVMVVTDKTNDIAILRTLGMGPANVVRVFSSRGPSSGGLVFSSASPWEFCWRSMCRHRARAGKCFWLPGHAGRRVLRIVDTVHP